MATGVAVPWDVVRRARELARPSGSFPGFEIVP